MLDTLILVIPVLLILVVIMTVVKLIRSDEGPWESMNGIIGLIPVTVVVLVSILIVAGMGAALAPYSWDEDSGELTINKNVGSGSQDWDSYGTDVKSLIINDNVTTVADGAFDTLTGLEYVSISDSVESITSSAFGVTLKDYLDQTITSPSAGEYVGTGDGTLYYSDSAIFTYNATNKYITGLASTASGAKNLVLPSETSGTTLTGVYSSAFASNTDVALVVSVPGCEISELASKAFQGCTALSTVSLDSVTTASSQVFDGCTALTDVELPSLESAGNNAFRYIGASSVSLPALETLGAGAFSGCTSLASASIPKVTALGNNVFDGCTALATIDLSKIETMGGSVFKGTALTAIDLSSLQSVGSSAFSSVTSVTSVTFGSGLTEVASNSFSYWTFYDTDGATEIDKTVASNLAGFRFTGTSTALVKAA